MEFIYLGPVLVPQDHLEQMTHRLQVLAMDKNQRDLHLMSRLDQAAGVTISLEITRMTAIPWRRARWVLTSLRPDRDVRAEMWGVGGGAWSFQSKRRRKVRACYHGGTSTQAEASRDDVYSEIYHSRLNKQLFPSCVHFVTFCFRGDWGVW